MYYRQPVAETVIVTSVPVARGPKGVKLCACNDGFTGTDVTDNCDANAKCTNNDDSFSCACKTDYKGYSIVSRYLWVPTCTGMLHNEYHIVLFKSIFGTSGFYFRDKNIWERWISSYSTS